MAYTGRAPSAAPLTSADINDGAVAPADLSTGAPSWDTSGNLTVGGGNVILGDNDKAIFGAGSDLQIYHDGSNSVIKDAGTGNLAITADNLLMESNNGDNYFYGSTDGAVYLYYDGAGKLTTTSTGIDVTGNIELGDSHLIGNDQYDNLGLYSSAGEGIALKTAAYVDFREGDSALGTNDGARRMLIDAGGDISFYEDSGTTAKFFWDASAERLRIGSTALTAYTAVDDVVIEGPASVGMSLLAGTSSIAGFFFGDSGSSTKGQLYYDNATDSFTMLTNATSNSGIVIDSSGNLLVGKDSTSGSTNGLVWISNGNNSYLSLVHNSTNSSLAVQYINRQSSDGYLLFFQQADSNEGGVSVSGTTVSYNGGHLSRWSQLPDSSRDESIVKGTVMTNLDAMCEWSHADEYWTEEDELPVDEEGNPTAAVGDLKKAAYTEDNEQLNRMVVSSVEGDPNVAGVFVNWDNDDDEFNDMNIAMTGDMVIRIAQGTTVARGDLLMSAGDGTAKPQGDDIVRSKTIAKVTSTNVSHTYDDGSYLVPCVLMAC